MCSQVFVFEQETQVFCFKGEVSDRPWYKYSFKTKDAYCKATHISPSICTWYFKREVFWFCFCFVFVFSTHGVVIVNLNKASHSRGNTDKLLRSHWRKITLEVMSQAHILKLISQLSESNTANN